MTDLRSDSEDKAKLESLPKIRHVPRVTKRSKVGSPTAWSKHSVRGVYRSDLTSETRQTWNRFDDRSTGLWVTKVEEIFEGRRVGNGAEDPCTIIRTTVSPTTAAEPQNTQCLYVLAKQKYAYSYSYSYSYAYSLIVLYSYILIFLYSYILIFLYSYILIF